MYKPKLILAGMDHNYTPGRLEAHPMYTIIKSRRTSLQNEP
jgi:hypothetical protein